MILGHSIFVDHIDKKRAFEAQLAALAVVQISVEADLAVAAAAVMVVDLAAACLDLRCCTPLFGLELVKKSKCLIHLETNMLMEAI